MDVNLSSRQDTQCMTPPPPWRPRLQYWSSLYLLLPAYVALGLYAPPPPPVSFEVDHVCNLTDVDDKIITRMARDGVTLKDLTQKYAALFFDDLESLNIIPASRYPRATEHIDDIVEMIQVRRWWWGCARARMGFLFVV